jgi:diaminohydroxyphosphoribosylaminopyrimidine deaminase/5-amino-6-(5-phosphoribosylamino)uracil reductase
MTDHEALMRRAIAMAETARLRARPNPWVGAVLVCADGSLFEGATQAPGGAHAEIECLRAARESGRDSTGAHLVVTLEPCSHTGRTGPCTEAIIAAGIASVTVAVDDPDERVSGSGIAALRAAGVDVTVGVLADEVTHQLAPYLHHRRTGRPFVVVKMASTLDWRTVAPAGERWITGDDARREVHRLRAESDAIAVGAGTVRADDPELTVRLIDGPSPRRVVLTRTPLPPTAKVHPCLEWSGSLDDLLDTLGSDGVVQLLVEGGAETVTSFHRAGFIDRWVLHVAPVVSGDDSAPGLFADDGAHAPERFDLVSHRQIGADLEIVFDRTKEKAGAR